MDFPLTTRETRGKSAEFDGRRINAVPPMHLGESMLQNLWKEHQQQQAATSGQPIPPPPPMQQPPIHAVHDQQKLSKGSSGSGSTSNDDNDRKLQQMLEKYQSQVKLQQQRNPATQQKTPSRNNIHKIEKVASTVRSTNPGAPQGRTMSHSQPCLIAITDRPPEYTALPLVNHPFQRRSSGSGEQPSTEMTNNGLQRVPNNQKLVNSLREENLHLKRDLESFKKKLSKVQQIESAYERIERDYDNLLREKERQESLEKTALAQMELHLKRIISEKESLQERLEQSAGTLASFQYAQALEKISQLNMMLADLITQNKELQACKERQKMEIDAQTATLEEQRNHIAFLDKALSNAQERIVKRERVCEELSQAAETAKMLQRQLHETLLDKQQRDESHSAERAQWEMEITQLKMQLNKDASLTGSLKRSNGARLSVDTGDEAVLRLKKSLHSKDERITQLERTVVELQRRLHEDSERKNGQLVSLSDNFESKIKKLEEEKSDKDRRIAELTEEREKLGDILGESRERGDLYFSRERDDETTRDINKMEEIRQKIQERKRKGRVGVGGLMGIGIDHSRSSSGSLMASAGSHRSTTGAFESTHFDPTALPDLSVSYNRPLDTNGNGLGGYTTTVAFKGDRREEEIAEPPAWKP